MAKERSGMEQAGADAREGRERNKAGGRSPQRSGQGTLEMIVIFAGMLLVMLVLLVAIPDQATAIQSVRSQSTATDTVQLLAQTANDVYLAGDGAEQTIWVVLPDGMDASHSFIGAQAGVSDWNARKVVDIDLLQSGDVFSVSRAPICGYWPSVPGRYQVLVAYNSTAPAHVMVNGSC